MTRRHRDPSTLHNHLAELAIEGRDNRCGGIREMVGATKGAADA